MSYAGWQAENWSSHLPRLLEPIGIASLWAASGREASHVIATHSIHIAVVDLGLPLDPSDPTQEAGPRLLDLLARLANPPPTVVMKRGRTHRDDSREIAAALKCGAFAVIDRPRSQRDIELLLEVLRRILDRRYHGRWPV